MGRGEVFLLFIFLAPRLKERFEAFLERGLRLRILISFSGELVSVSTVTSSR